MSRLVLDYDPETRTTEYYDYDEETGVIRLSQEQDVEPLIEASVRAYNATDHSDKSRWRRDIVRVASISNTHILELNQKGIMRGYKIVDERAFYRWLRAEASKFITIPGRLG